ncbi:MAG: THUMP domain-containing protein [Methanosarcinales archaeon Met12]|nr:MAG: THUMP domain-containing protein [Methanosarcinales archaeon Met12]
MLNYDAILIRYGEIGLKSKRVRSRYERILVENIKAVLHLHKKTYSGIRRDRGRIFTHSNDPDIADVVANVFGVVSTSPVITTDPDLQMMAQMAADVGELTIHQNESFAIRARKAGVHDFSSRDIGVSCGDAVYERIKGQNPSIDLTSPDKEIFIEVRPDKAYVYTKIIKGVGGLPLGTQGRMVALITDDISSSVAVWLMMRRGCEIIPVCCDNAHLSGAAEGGRAVEHIKILQRWAPNYPMKIHEVPHGGGVENTYRIAAEIAKKERAHGIITGSSLEQVAAQISADVLAEALDIDFPICRPLIGMDRAEIVSFAKRIGIF